MFFLPNIDIGIAQDPIFFDGDPQGWATFLPGHGPTRMILEASYTGDFDPSGAGIPALASLVVARRRGAPATGGQAEALGR